MSTTYTYICKTKPSSHPTDKSYSVQCNTDYIIITPPNTVIYTRKMIDKLYYLKQM